MNAVTTEDYKSLFEPVRNKRTFEDVSDRLKELIFNGALKPGQQLPSETALAQLFQVGRQSVREALRILELSGFIRVRPGVKGGAVVESTILSKIGSLFLDAFKFDRVSMEDFTTARRAIEVSMLDFVFKNAGRSDIESLRDNVARAKARIAGNSPAFEENIEFHRLLAKASRNYVFSIVMEAILAVLADFKSKFTVVRIEQSKNVVDCHAAIVTAIAEKKKPKAVVLLKKDLMGASEILIGRTHKERKRIVRTRA